MDMGAPPALWLLAPFAILILAIAIGPLLIAPLWHRRYPLISTSLAAIVIAYYLLIRRNSAPVISALEEYISFIALIGSLFVVSGGIRIGVAGESTPFRNVVFLLLGGLLANFLGTTGAAMLLIRPWIRMNRYRITGYHIVFFIFVVANVGGCLTPIGDPPLFLGYLRGVPFFWPLQHLWPEWLAVIGLLLIVFYLFDRANFNRAPKKIQKKETDNSAHNRRVATSLRPGFSWGEELLRQEWVEVFVFTDQKPEKPMEPSQPEIARANPEQVEPASENSSREGVV